MQRLTVSCLSLAALVAWTQHDAMAQKVDYQRADMIRMINFVVGGEASARWLKDSVRFWYVSTSKADRGIAYLVDPRSASRVVLFDNAKLAAALSIASDTIMSPTKLGSFSLSDDTKFVEWGHF